MSIEPCAEPLKVTASEGFVIVEGGCGVNVTLTPPAAIATSDELFDGAAHALGQRKMRGQTNEAD